MGSLSMSSTILPPSANKKMLQMVSQKQIILQESALDKAKRDLHFANAIGTADYDDIRKFKLNQDKHNQING